MLNKFRTVFLVALVATQVCCAEQTTKTIVKVVDESGVPISGVDVKVAYPLMRTGDYSTGSGITGDEGLYTYLGESLAEFFVTANKEGYYESRYQGKVYSVSDSQRIFSSPKVVLTLKEIKEPISMYARARLEFVIPKPNREFGFDLEVADWVAPHGKGRSTDIIFAVNGYYNGLNDNESRLVVSFPNEGDGLIQIEGNYRQGSKLMSPHVAPEEGYAPRKEWSKSRKENPDATGEAHTQYIITDDYKAEGVNYLLRVRTILDPQGDAISAHYGKIYGDFKFFGAHEDGSFIGVDALYFNPTTNDRNLEYKVGENLNTGLRHSLNPHLP